MNNEQFRRLVAVTAPKPDPDSNDAAPPSATPRAGSTLGSRQRSSIPMTPRAVAGLSKSDFARQMAERNQSGDKPSNGTNKFKSYAPKGVKLAEGYVDRAQARSAEAAAADDDDRARRIKTLEEALKKEKIDQDTFDRLRAQIAGGDLSSTHLVKGLDFKLLERVRQGEDVWEAHEKDGAEEPAQGEDVDDAFDELEQSEVGAVAREKAAKKKGQYSTTNLNPGKKRTRDQILAEMKAAREAKAKESALGTRFKKIGAKMPGSRIERDSKGREVLVIVDEDGNEKRKVRKVEPSSNNNRGPRETEAANTNDLMMPDKDAKPLGMEVPEFYKQKMAQAQAEEEEEDDTDIFAGVGDDYDPLGDLGSDSEEDGGEKSETETEEQPGDKTLMPPPPVPAAGSRNYFKDSKTALVSSETLKAPSMSDPAIQAAFKKAATLKALAKTGADEDEDEDEEAARAKVERRRRMLQNDDRDAEDMDMGFGTSRFEDEDDFEDKKVKLSKWGGKDDDEHGHGDAGGGGAKRKRGPKKRKGDGNNAADVMRLVEQRRS